MSKSIDEYYFVATIHGGSSGGIYQLHYHHDADPNLRSVAWVNLCPNVYGQKQLPLAYAQYNNPLFTKALPVIINNNINGWVVTNEENLTAIAPKYFIGAFYCTADVNGYPTGSLNALTTWGANNDWGWNATKPAANVNSATIAPNGVLMIGKQGNIFATRAPITASSVEWQQLYNVETIVQTCPTEQQYKHIGYVNTATKTVLPISERDIWIGQADRLVFRSDNGNNDFYSITDNPCYIINYATNNTATPKTKSDCWFVSKNNFDASDQNIYIGIGEGYASDVGNGHVLVKNNNSNTLNEITQWTIDGDPLKLMCTINAHKYLLVNQAITGTPFYRKRLHVLGATLNTWNEISFSPALNNLYAVPDAIVSNDESKIFAIIVEGGITKVNVYTNNFNGTATLENTINFNGATVTPKLLEMIRYSVNKTEYKIICGTIPNSLSSTDANLWQVYDSDFPNVITAAAITPTNSLSNIFVKLNIDNLDNTDEGVTATGLYEDNNTIYIATVHNDATLNPSVKAHIYSATYDPLTGNINSNSWEDVSNGMPNKTVISMSTVGSTSCDENLYVCLRGLGAWKLKLHQRDINQTYFDNNTTLSNNCFLTQSVVCNHNFTIDAANLGIAPGVTITVMPGKTLTINNASHLYSCGDMWQGIINNGGTVVMTGCTIEDAQVTLQDDFGLGIFNITNTTFNRNGVNIMLRYGNYNTSIFTNNIFKCDAPLKSTNIYNATYTYAHFHLYAISNINIGSISNTNTNNNKFSDARYGIHAEIAAINLYRNTFTNITESALHAIYYGGALNIGGVNGTNEFDDCASGVQIAGDYELHTTQNNFTNCGYGILAQNVFAFPIEISQNNFTNCGDALTVADLKANPYCRILDNRFTGGFDANGIPTNENAITVFQLSTIGLTTEIKDNVIDDYMNGIFTVGLIGNAAISPIISNNFVNFNFAETKLGANNYIGITAQNCNRTVIDDNTIAWTATVAVPSNYASVLKGMQITDCQNCNINENHYIQNGTAIYLQNFCQGTVLTCNYIETTKPGIFCDNLTLPTQGAPNQCNLNSWHATYTIALPQIDGVNTPKIRWYFDGSNLPSNVLCPYHAAPQLIERIQTTSISQFACADNTQRLLDSLATEEAIDGTVTDSSTYTYNTEENENNNTEYAFGEMQSDSTKINTAERLLFYQTAELQNTGRFSDADLAIELGNLVDALSANNNVIDTNLMDSNLKTVNNILIPTLINDSIPISAGDTSILENIAELDALHNGKAVYKARVYLKKRKVDNNIGVMRKGNPSNFAYTEHNIKVYPNPINENGVLFINATSPIISLELVDMFGKTIYKAMLGQNKNTTYLNLKYYAPAMYYLHVKTQDNEKRFQVIKIK